MDNSIDPKCKPIKKQDISLYFEENAVHVLVNSKAVISMDKEMATNIAKLINEKFKS